MTYYLAIDGGGTKTQALCADETGQVVGQGMSGATSLTATSVGAAGFSLRESVRQCLTSLEPGVQLKKAVMGLAGMDTVHEYKTAKQAFSRILSHFQIQEFILVNDIEIALESGSENLNALALIAGTGSNCFGRNSNGQTAKVGGLDYLLTDQGSGFEIGRRVLREAVKSFDGRSPKSILEQLVLQHFGIRDIPDLKQKIYNPLISKANVAELAPLCFQAKDQGDAVAIQILQDVVTQLVIMVDAAMTRLALNQVQADLVLAGSIAKNQYIYDLLTNQLVSKYPQLRIVIPTHEPVYGALKIALK